jgi:hypothetical protein
MASSRVDSLPSQGHAADGPAWLYVDHEATATQEKEQAAMKEPVKAKEGIFLLMVWYTTGSFRMWEVPRDIPINTLAALIETHAGAKIRRLEFCAPIAIAPNANDVPVVIAKRKEDSHGPTYSIVSALQAANSAGPAG